MTLPVFALVGRPNVGKSTLFNRLTATRDALVADVPGLTRDRQYGIGRLGSGPYLVVDTGGLSGESTGVDVLIQGQARQAIEECDVVVLLVDGRAGLGAADEDAAELIRRCGKQVVLAVNKCEGLPSHSACAEFQSLGFDSVVAISAAHGQGVNVLVDELLARTTTATESTSDEEKSAAESDGPSDSLRLAVVGRPNVGKSTLINRLIGEDRVLTFDAPGTTRDSVAIPFERQGTRYTLIDTAGVRRRARVKDLVEKFSVIKTLKAIEQAHVVVLMLDARDGITEQDASLLGLVIEAGKAIVIAVNKWDGLSPDQRSRVRSELSRRLSFLDYATVHTISALHGSGIVNVLSSARKAHTAALCKLATADLTRVLHDAVQAHQPPLVRGHRIKLRYAHQGGRNPPLVIIHGTRTNKIPDTYRRYLVNTFRKAFDLQGTPVRVEFRNTENPYAGRAPLGHRRR